MRHDGSSGVRKEQLAATHRERAFEWRFHREGCMVDRMNDQELHRRLKAYAMGWKETGELLEEERRERVRTADTAQALAALSGLFDSAVRLQPATKTSGLVEQQAIFARARR
jgi:hypothetical protein